MPEFSIGGSRIQVVVGSTVIAGAMGIRFNRTRKVNPLYGMGDIDPQAFGRSVRLVSGSLDYVIFDNDALKEALKDTMSAQKLAKWANSSGDIIGTAEVESVTTKTQTDVGLYIAQVTPADITEMLPVDIIVLGLGEQLVGENQVDLYKLILHDVMFVSEDFGIDVDSTAPVKRVEFIARRITPWAKSTETLTTAST